MDNLVDIDALLGNLELEAGDFQQNTQSTSSNCQSIQSTTVAPTANGLTHASANGSHSMHSEVNAPKTTSYMDDLLDISVDADFGPSMSSLQLGPNEKLEFPSTQQQPLQQQALSDFNNIGIYNASHVLPNQDSSTSKCPELLMQSNAGLSTADKQSGSSGREFDIFNLPNLDQSNMSSALKPLNFPPQPNLVLERPTNNVSSISSHRLRPSFEVTSSHSPSLTGSEPVSLASLTEQQGHASHPTNKNINTDYALPLTDDIDFLTKYEHQRSTTQTQNATNDDQYSHSSSLQYSVPNHSAHSQVVTTDAPVSAQAPSLGQFSSEFCFSANPATEAPNFSQLMRQNLEPSQVVSSETSTSDFRNFTNFEAVDTANSSIEHPTQSFDGNLEVSTNLHYPLSRETSVSQTMDISSEVTDLFHSIDAPKPSNDVVVSVQDSQYADTNGVNDSNGQPNHGMNGISQLMLTEELLDNGPTSSFDQLEPSGPSQNHLVSNNLTSAHSGLHRSQPEIHSNLANLQIPNISASDGEFPPEPIGGRSFVMPNSGSSAISVTYNHSSTPMHSVENSQVSNVQTNNNTFNSEPTATVETTPTLVPSIPVNQQLDDFEQANGVGMQDATENRFASIEPDHNRQECPSTGVSLDLLNGAHDSLLNSSSDFQAAPKADSNMEDEFNSLLAANGYPMLNGNSPSAPLNNTNDSFTTPSQDTATNLSSPLVTFGSLQKDPNMSGSIDSFTKLQYTAESQQAAESFTALHNMSISQAHRNSLLEQNGILPTSEVEEDMGWDIGATTTSVVGADDVFADIGLDEPVTGEVSFNNVNTDFGPIDELPPGEVPAENNASVPGFVEDNSTYFTDHSADMYVTRDNLVSTDLHTEPTATTGDLQAMVTPDEEEPDVPDTETAAHAGDLPDIPPPPYQVTDPALDPQSYSDAPEPSPEDEQEPQQGDFSGDSVEFLDMGATKPLWVPDSETDVCMACEVKFSFTRRRHHCRSCGKIFCDSCSNMRSRLQYLDFKEARVCRICHENIALAAEQQARLFSSQLSPHAATGQSPVHHPPADSTGAAAHSPVAANASTQDGGAEGRPMPAGVLKDTTANRASVSREANRSVIFSDGIRPGDENSHLDGSDINSSSRVRRKSKNRQKTNQRLRETLRNTFLIPETSLPPLLCFDSDSSQYSAVDSEPDEMGLITKLKEEADDGRFAFAIHKDLRVEIKIVNMDCCTGKQCWCFTSHGLNTVSQDEVVFVLECLPDENTIPRDVFHLYKMLYQQAASGQQVTELGYADLSSVAPFDSSNGFLGSTDHTALLFIRSTFQCTKGLCLPSPPFLFAVLIHKLELPWARLFPVRLKLRLGAEFKYYPCPLMSVRGRAPVYREISNTIMNLLADFHTYKYSLSKIEGFTVHLMDKVTTISIPKNMYPSVMKVVGASQECVIAFGASFSSIADSHIVCMQNEDGSYTSRTMNIRDQQRTVTGASFVVFSGSMKESYGVSAKCSIVEDGIMVQITKEALDEFKAKLNSMQEYTVTCSRTEDSKEPNEQVKIVWVDDYKDYNIGVVSPVDGFPMDGVMSLRVKSFNDLTRDSYTIRWTEVFFVQVDESRLTMDAMEITQFSETIANSTCSALAPFLGQLHTHGMKKVALRVTIGPEQVEYVCGSQGCKLKADLMNSLDGELVPVLHSAASVITGSLLVLELIFHVLE